MNLIKDSITINEIVCRSDCDISAGGDIIVPDIKPDILKILQVDAISVVTGKEIKNGHITLSGKVKLKILYIPDRANEAVKSILTDFDYSHQFDNPDFTEEMICVAESDVSAVNFNPINSRKLNVKVNVRLECCVTSNTTVDLVTDVESDTYTEICKKPFNLCATVAESEENFTVKDSVEIPSGKSSIYDVLKIDYRVSDKELKPVTEKLVAKGVINSCILYVGDNNSIEFMEFDIPFTEVFGVNNINDNSKCDITYVINDMTFEISEDSDGDKRIINIEYILTAQISACEDTSIDIVSDFYCPGFETNLTRQAYSLNNTIYQTRTQNNLREIVAVDSNLPQIMGVYNVITKAYITKSELERGKLLTEGIIDCYILYLSDSTDNPLFSFKKEIPFNYILDAPGCNDDSECLVNAEIEHCSYSLNLANEVELRCILSIYARITENKSIDIISDYTIDEISDTAKKGIVIYFVQSGDSVWSIARHYRVAMSDIISLNNLDPNAQLSVGQQLIIPVSQKKSA